MFQKNIRDIISPRDKELSSREMNRAKRMARQAVNKQKSRENLDDNVDEPEAKKVKLEVKEEQNSYFGKWNPLL